jgi:hypothetical protein
MRQPQWVVTYRHEQIDGGVMVAEFFRGTREECIRIMTHSGEGENDKCPTSGWKAVMGTARSWDVFIADMNNEGEVILEIGCPRR